jgi:hypothetical protein
MNQNRLTLAELYEESARRKARRERLYAVSYSVLAIVASLVFIYCVLMPDPV